MKDKIEIKTGCFSSGKKHFKYQLVNGVWSGMSQTWLLNGSRDSILFGKKHQYNGLKVIFIYEN